MLADPQPDLKYARKRLFRLDQCEKGMGHDKLDLKIILKTIIKNLDTPDIYIETVPSHISSLGRCIGSFLFESVRFENLLWQNSDS